MRKRRPWTDLGSWKRGWGGRAWGRDGGLEGGGKGVGGGLPTGAMGPAQEGWGRRWEGLSSCLGKGGDQERDQGDQDGESGGIKRGRMK